MKLLLLVAFEECNCPLSDQLDSSLAVNFGCLVLVFCLPGAIRLKTLFCAMQMCTLILLVHIAVRYSIPGKYKQLFGTV